MAKPEEAVDEWEHIESLNSLHEPPASAPGLAATTSAVIRDNYLRVSNSSGVFPPAHHEGLDLGDGPARNLIPLPPDSPLSSASASPEAALSRNGRNGESGEDGTWRGIWGIVRRRAWARMWFEVSVWKLVSATGIVGAVAAAAVVYVKMVVRRRRLQRRVALTEENKNRLILLIKEKDQRIEQLLLQISQMNEMVSGRRRVPVVRVG